MVKLDLHKELKHLYTPSAKKVEVVDVPRFQFVMIDGKIEPGLGPGSSPAFQQAMQAMYGAAYTLKFMSKLSKEDPIDYPVMALEGLWFIEEGDFDIKGTYKLQAYIAWTNPASGHRGETARIKVYEAFK